MPSVQERADLLVERFRGFEAREQLVENARLLGTRADELDQLVARADLVIAGAIVLCEVEQFDVSRMPNIASVRKTLDRLKLAFADDPMAPTRGETTVRWSSRSRLSSRISTRR